MGLFSEIFGMPQATQSTSASGAKRSLPVSEKNTITFTKGEVVKGEVTDLRSSEVTIRLEGGKTLHARLSSAMELSIGQKAEFFVQETNDALITLKLLSDGDTSFTEAAIDQALEASGFPKSSNAVAVVRSLLNAGLPANKEMIQKMLQHSAANKEVALSTLTALLKNNLPVTKENATQLQAYRNFEHRLVGQAAALTASLGDAFRSGETPTEFTKALLSHFFSDSTQSSSYSSGSAFATPMEDTPSVVFPGPAAVHTPAGIKDTLQDGVSSSPMSTAEDTSLPIADAPVSAQTEISSAALKEITLSISKEYTPLHTLLTEDEYRQLGEVFTKLPPEFSEFDLLNRDYTNKVLTANQLFSVFSRQSEASATVNTLLTKNRLLSSLLEQTILERFVLTPETLAKEDGVKKFYEHISEDLSLLTDLAGAASKESGESGSLKKAADTGAKMQDNLRFMNTLNRLFPYVQLPLRLTEQLTHGELYVYTKKKDLSDRTREVSILLHLDMDFLGPTDIHLTLLQQTVAAKFYLTEETAQALVAEELPLLTASLQEKGYTLSAQVMQREKEPDIVNDFMEGGEAVSMKRFRFDIRA